MKSSTFDENYFTNVQIVEFPDNLEAPFTDESVAQGEMIVDEETKEGVSPLL